MPDEPLTLDCFCPGDDSIIDCTVQKLTFIIQGTIHAQSAVVTLAGGPFTITRNILNATEEIELVPTDDWLDAWDTLYVFMTLGSTLVLGGCDEVADAGDNAPSLAVASCTVSIKVDWACVDLASGEDSAKTEFRSALSGGGELTCLGTCGLPPKAVQYKSTWAGGSSVGGGVSFSRSLSDVCDYFDSPSISNFGTNPRDDEKFEVNRTDKNWCLCAAGGTAPYHYRIKTGVLPCGLALDSATGCITGAPDETCHGTTVTFEVFDSAGNSAETTCNFVPDCVDGEESGNFAL